MGDMKQASRSTLEIHFPKSFAPSEKCAKFYQKRLLASHINCWISACDCSQLQDHAQTCNTAVANSLEQFCEMITVQYL